MKPSSLALIAGPAARERLLQGGLHPDLFRGVVAASGGPKWFVLKALDQYLFGEFFKDRQDPLATMGSSAGAWQMACFAQPDPVAAIERLAHYYSRTRYSAKPTAREVSASSEAMVDILLGEQGARAVADHPVIQTHIIINRCKGPVRSEQKGIQLLGLMLASIANSVSREKLGLFFERVIMHSGEHSFFQPEGFNTRYGRLQENNVRASLLASGSIPIVLEGISDIPGAPSGIYRDGGIIDYHFDLPFCKPEEGLIIYPHFSQTVTPGWFDKGLGYRKVSATHYDNVLLVTPSRHFVESLPFQKIPDRKDFEKMDDDTRLKAWARTLDACKQMADDFDRLCSFGIGESDLRTFSP